MKFDKNSLLLYAVTDRSWLGGRTLLEDVEQAVLGGVTFVQLREKDLPYEAFCQEARTIGAFCRTHRIPFVINDNVEVALATQADGVHVGQHDQTAQEVRRLIGPDKILGISAQTVEQALLAEAQGADYLGVGSVFPTSTKLDADAVSLETLRAICEAVRIPVVAIGGITQSNTPRLAGSGIAGIAVVSAIFAQPDIQRAAKELRTVTEQVL